MRPLVVLLILAAAMIALAVSHEREVKSFDGRFEKAQERIRSLADEIDNELERTKEPAINLKE